MECLSHDLKSHGITSIFRHIVGQLIQGWELLKKIYLYLHKKSSITKMIPTWLCDQKRSIFQPYWFPVVVEVLDVCPRGSQKVGSRLPLGFVVFSQDSSKLVLNSLVQNLVIKKRWWQQHNYGPIRLSLPAGLVAV